MNWLWASRYGGENCSAKPGPKNNVEWISEGEKCAVGEIPAAGGGGSGIQFPAVKGILEGIPGKFEHQQYADQAEDAFGNIVLNDESQAGEGDDRLCGIPDEGAKLDE